MDDMEAFDSEFQNQEIWTETLVFPNPSKLDDAGMDYYFPDYDGRWSAQTKRAMKALETDGLELNSNWALERQHWTCPGCQRSKFDVFRKSSNGILLAKLELHHDHMSEEAKQRPAKVAGPEWRAALGEGGSRVMDTIRALVVRFDTALVCSECNAADGKAKTSVGTDPRFTFVATEIRQFVKATPHRDHEIDIEAARAVWEAERPAFEHRLALLASLVDDLFARRLQNRSEGALPYGRSMVDRVGTGETLRKSFWKSARFSPNNGLLNTIKTDFLSRSVSNDTAKRKAPKAPPRAPTDEEYNSFVPQFGTQKWNEVDDDWSCPCCCRGKRASIRMSSKKKWTAAIRNVAQYDILLNQDEIALRERLFPDFANDLHLVQRRWVAVCSDCADITTRL
ncbi:hypothetical protein [Pararhizobium antarcticum]|uniref:Uncharacterized protein n=1 Tax=Pararhizobium antarcticum TaxID=1798805 RepID=A0A657LJR1_9HYPH|nr:hypothetical protein [Pararhizobium antarcticum]OJF89621.1 hypothetical protein AX760_24920 [Pararhizobium antarcticum]